MTFDSRKLEDTRDAAAFLLKVVNERAAKNSGQGGAIVVALSGDLGAGKTTFTQHFGDLLGIKDKIVSPTFVIEKIYKIGEEKSSEYAPLEHLIHIDAYRLESEKEMERLGWEEIVADPGNVILVEWPERIQGLLPQDCVRVQFEHVDEVSRKININ